MNQSINPARRPLGVSVSVGAGGLTQWQPAELSDSGAVLLSLSGRSSSAVHEAGQLCFLYGLWRS